MLNQLISNQRNCSVARYFPSLSESLQCQQVCHKWFPIVQNSLHFCVKSLIKFSLQTWTLDIVTTCWVVECFFVQLTDEIFIYKHCKLTPLCWLPAGSQLLVAALQAWDLGSFQPSSFYSARLYFPQKGIKGTYPLSRFNCYRF